MAGNPTTGEFVWNDLFSPDPEKAKAFYTALFGWQSSEMEIDGRPYTMVGPGEARHSGINGIDPATGTPPHWISYAVVPDVDAAAETAHSLGGRVAFGPIDTPGIGRFATIGDPDGAFVAVFKFEDEATYNPIPQGDGNPCWFEVGTNDEERAKTFYEKVVGWDCHLDEGPWGRYFTFKSGETPRAGMMQIPEGESWPPAWLIYFLATDIEATANKAADLGGQIYKDPFEVPGVGHIAIVADPAGAVFGLFKPNPDVQM